MSVFDKTKSLHVWYSYMDRELLLLDRSYDRSELEQWVGLLRGDTERQGNRERAVNYGIQQTPMLTCDVRELQEIRFEESM